MEAQKIVRCIGKYIPECFYFETGGIIIMSGSGKTTVLGMPLRMYIALLAITVFIACQGYLLNNIMGAFACAMIVGTAFGLIGDKIPFWKDWLGGGILFANLAASFINTFKLFPESTIKTMTVFNGSQGFLELYVVILIFGSVLSVERRLLIRSFIGYIPTILGAIAGSFILCAGAAVLLGSSPVESVLSIAIPIMGGGNGAGAIPMSKIYGEVTGNNPSVWYASAFAVLMLGNIMAVLFAAFLNRLGERFPALTGNGKLLDVPSLSKEAPAQKQNAEISMITYAAAFTLALFVYMGAHYYAGKVSLINNYLHLGFKIHKFAFMIIFVMLLNISNCVPDDLKAAAKNIQGFFVKYLSFPLLFCVGLSTNLNDYIKVLSIQVIVYVFVVVLGACLGAALVGKLFHFYPIEAMITAGLCMANAGGSGDVQVLGTAKRMELMPYAAISSRIGGAILLVIASFMFSKFM